MSGSPPRSVMPTAITETPLLSVVVALVGNAGRPYDLSHLEGCLAALEAQNDPPSMEVVVPLPTRTPGIEDLGARHPEARFVPVDDLRALRVGARSVQPHDELCARGVAACRGRIVALVEDQARPLADWSREIVDAHREDYAGIGGAIENGLDHPLNWATYFCDFGRYQNPVLAGPTSSASDANVSYKRDALEAIRPVWKEAFCEPEVNRRLLGRGERLALSPKIIVYQLRRGLRLGSALRERFSVGRSYAAARSQGFSGAKRLLFAGMSPLLPLVLLARLVVAVSKKRRNLRAFLGSLPLIVCLLVVWSSGELWGYLAGSRGAGRLW